MALKYYPKQGEILLCDYGAHVVPPEMTKRRPVVIISPRLRRRPDLVAIVPLSTTAPVPAEDHHCEIALNQPLPAPFQSPLMWAKCDMVATVSLLRLDRFKERLANGARVYRSGHLTIEQLKIVQAAVLHGLGLSSLTIHL